MAPEKGPTYGWSMYATRAAWPELLRVESMLVLPVVRWVAVRRAREVTLSLRGLT